MSMSAALAYRWDGKKCRLVFQTKPDSYNTQSLILFLKYLRRELRGQKCILIWDGLPAHKSNEMKAFLGTQTDWLSVVMLPGYCPDLNPVEALWGNVKGQELANLCALDLGEVADALKLGIGRVRRRLTLAWSFLKHAGLFL
jgi:transposase